MTGQEVLYIVIAIAVSLAVIILEAWALWYAFNPEKLEHKERNYKAQIKQLETERDFYEQQYKNSRIDNHYLTKLLNEKENEPNRS